MKEKEKMKKVWKTSKLDVHLEKVLKIIYKEPKNLKPFWNEQSTEISKGL